MIRSPHLVSWCRDNVYCKSQISEHTLYIVTCFVKMCLNSLKQLLRYVWLKRFINPPNRSFTFV